MQGQEPRVFISYHRADLDAAERVRAYLTAHGVHTWMDRYDIPVGAYWPDEIDRGLADSPFVLGILSPDSVASRNVKNEWDWALQNDRHLILLKTRPCVLPHRYVSVNFLEADDAHFEQALDELARVPGLAPAAAELPVTRYALAGEVSIAYQQFGTGQVDLVWVPGYLSHCELTWRTSYIAAHFRRLGTLFRVIIFDKRGTGMSDRSAIAEPLEHRMDDIRAVMDACGVERAVVAGLSEGVPLACLFAATYPERTHALALYGGYAAEYRHDDYPWPPTLAEREAAIERDVKTLYRLWATETCVRGLLEIYAPSMSADPETIAVMTELLKLGSSPGAVIALSRTNLLVDVRGILPAIRVPAFVFHKTGDRACMLEEGRYVAEHIPGAEFVEIPGDDHVPWLGAEEPYFDRLQKLAGEIQRGTAAIEEPETVLAAVAVIIGTGANRIELIAAAEHAARQFRGHITNHADHERVVARFDGPARAIRFAEALVRAEGSGNGARAGVHVGEVATRGERTSGRAVDEAARLAAAARPGQILASGIVRDLAPGSGIRFDPIGAAPDAPGVYAVTTESTPRPAP